jgi:hypothetical protein
VYFTDKSNLKPSGMGTIRIKFPRFLYFLLHNVLYLPETKRSLLSLVNIKQQVHSIHIIGGKFEIQKDYDNMLVMTRMEDRRLLKLNGTYSHTQNVAYLSNHGEGIMPYSILWNVIFGHINYESLRLFRKNGVSGLPTIPRKMKQ